MILLKKKKTTMDCNWPNSLAGKKNQKGNVKKKRGLASARAHFCLGLHAWATLMNHLIFEGIWFLLCFMSSP